MTDAMWGQEQTWDHDYFPTATSLKYNMAYQNKVTVDSVYDIPKALRKAMDKKLGSVMIAFKEKIEEEDATVASAVTSLIDEQLMNGNYKDMPYCLGGYNWVQDPDDEAYLFNVNMAGYNEGTGNTGLSEEEMEKLRKAVEKAFKGLQPAEGQSGQPGMTEDVDTMSESENGGEVILN